MTVRTGVPGTAAASMPHRAATETTRPLAHAYGCWSPSFSANGRRIAFVSDRDGHPRVYLMTPDDDGGWTAVDTGPHPVQEVRWSRDGRWLAALVAPGGGPRTQVWLVRPGGRGLHQIAPEHEGAVFLGPWSKRPGRLTVALTTTLPDQGYAVLLDPRDNAGTPILRGGQPVVIDITPDGTRALVRRGPRGRRRLHLLEVATGEEHALLPDAGPGSTDLGRLSPDGSIAFVRSDAGRERAVLLAVPLPTRLPCQDPPAPGRVMAERSDAELELLTQSPDGTELALVWNHDGRSELELLHPADGRATAVPVPEPVIHGLTFNPGTDQLAMTLEGPATPRSLFLLDTRTHTWERLVGDLDCWPCPGNPVHPTVERIIATDGTAVTGWLYEPPHRQGPGPAVVYLHGGPEAQERPGFSPLFTTLVAAGITVFTPNVRGSSGFGRHFVDADNLAGRFGAIQDVADCVAHLVAAGIAAQGRIACMGRSYGGYLTLAQLVFHPGLYAAGVDICGMVDFQTFYAHTEPWIASAAYPKYGHPVTDAALLHDLSPLHRMDRLAAPLLVVHGANDTNVPVLEAEQTVTAARYRGVPVEYLLFPDEGHEILQVHNRELFVAATAEFLIRVLDVDPANGGSIP